jgi:hypothetical protein
VHEHVVDHSLHHMHCIYVSDSYLHVAIDNTEQERVEPPERAPVETADYEQDQGKAQCI